MEDRRSRVATERRRIAGSQQFIHVVLSGEANLYNEYDSVHGSQERSYVVSVSKVCWSTVPSIEFWRPPLFWIAQSFLLMSSREVSLKSNTHVNEISELKMIYAASGQY